MKSHAQLAALFCRQHSMSERGINEISALAERVHRAALERAIEIVAFRYAGAASPRATEVMQQLREEMGR